MKKFAYAIIFGFIFFFSGSLLTAQPWIENLKQQDPSYTNPDREGNFYDIQKSFYEYWDGKDTTQRSIGWKQFKRWEWFWAQRVYPNGIFPNPDITYKEMKAFEATNKSKKPGSQIQSNATWTSLGPFTSPGGYAGLGRINVVKEHPNNQNIIYIGSASGGFWYTTNGGASWTTTTDDLGSMGVTDIVFDPMNPSHIYIATGDGDASDAYSVGVMQSYDGGLTWLPTGLNWTQSQTRTISRLLIDPVDPNVIYAGGSFGIYKTTNAGASWTQIFSSMSVKDMEFKPGTRTTIYAAGAYIYRTTDGGTGWSQLTSGLPASAQRVALGVTPANSNYIYALMSNSGSGFLGMYRSTDGGNSWSTRSTTPNLLGWDIAGGDSGGQGWYDLCMAVDQSNPELIYTGGVNVWKSTNGGTNWTLSAHWYGGGGAAEVHADIHDLWFAPGTNRLYTGNDGGIYRTSDNGVIWQWLGNGLNITQFYRLGASQTHDQIWIAGAQDNGTKNYVGGNWQDVIGGDGMECMIDHTDPNYQYGSLYYGRILRSSDGGYNFWDWVSTGNFTSESGAWVTPFTMHPTSNQTIYIGYRNVYKTTNRGTSWTKLTNWSGSSLQLLKTDPDNANYIYASHGSDLYMTSDGGTNWVQKVLPGSYYLTYLAVKNGSPQTIYGSFSGYTAGAKVFVSNDAGTTWMNISYNLPNLPVNTIVYQKTTGRLYCGNDIDVYYLDPGQTEWKQFSHYLPNVIVNEIELQPKFSKMKVATYGRGVWETPIFSGDPVVLNYPANAATGISKNTSLTWNAINMASNYELVIADNPNFTNPKIQKMSITAPNYTILAGETLNAYTLYYWKVRAIDDQAFGEWSETRSFRTIQDPAGNVALNKPDNFSTLFYDDVTLSWFQANNANTYDLQVSTVSNFASTVLNLTGLTNLNFVANNLSNSAYFWRVRAVNESGNGAWSSTYKFTVEVLVPEKVNLSTPPNNSTNISITPELRWLNASGAYTYDIQVSKDVNFTNLVLNATGHVGTSYFLSALDYFATYYWRVRGVHPSNIGPWSDTWKFQTTSAPFVLNLSDKSICKGSPIDLGTLDAGGNVITATGGSGNFEYTWYPPTLLLNPGTGNPTFANPQLGTLFTLTVKDRVLNTTQTGTVYVSVISPILINMPYYKSIRKNTWINLDQQIFSITGGTPPYTKVWKNSSGLVLQNLNISPASGSHSFYLTVTDTKGCETTRRLMVIVSSYRDGINEDNIVSNENGTMLIIAYPNPTVDNLYYTVISNTEGTVEIEICDLNGKTLLRNTAISDNESVTNISNLPSGTYFLKANNNGETLMYKFIKK